MEMRAGHDIDTPEGMLKATIWLQSLLDNLSPKALWLVPRCASAYAIDKTLQTVTLIEGPGDDAIRRVFLKLGYTVHLIAEEVPDGATLH